MSDKTIPCPNCGKPTQYDSSNSWRPFCSRRCKLIDLGDWLHEEHQIPGEQAAPDGSTPWINPSRSQH